MKLKSHTKKGISSAVKRGLVPSKKRGIWHQVESAFHVFHDYYIPHHGNSHKPKIFHAHSVHVIAAGLLALKLFLVIAIFSVTPVGAWLSPSVESEMISLTNEYRRTLGEQPLVRNAYLDQVAKVRAQDMIDRNYFSHYTPEGKKPWQWIDAGQYNYDRFGENLAADFITAKAVLDAFKLSPTHDKNVRNENYRDIGIATVSGQLDGRETNIMVVFYASLKTPKTPTVVVTPTPTLTPTPTPTPTPVAVVPTPKPATVVTPKPAVPVPIPVDQRLNPPTETVAQGTTTASTTTVGSVDDPLAFLTTQVEGVETGIPAQEVISVATQPHSWLARLLSWSHNFYFLVFISFLLLAAINIFVSYRVQHHSAIIASFILIVLAGSLWALSWQGFDIAHGVVSILGARL